MRAATLTAGCGVGALTWALRRGGVCGVDGELHPAEVMAALGGIGFHYRLAVESGGARPLLDGLADGLSARVEPVLDAAALLGARPTVAHRPDEEATVERVRAMIEGAAAVLTWVDRGSVPYDPLPRGYQRMLSHLVGLRAADDDGVELVDRSAQGLAVDWLRFRLAWSQCSIEPPRLLVFAPSAPLAPARPVDLLERVRRGLTAHLRAPIGDRGVAGIRTLAARLRSPGHAGSWRRAFGRGAGLFHAHAALYRFIEEGPGPGLGRGLFADALERLGAAAAMPAVAEAGARWRAIGDDWRALAAGALPDDVPGLGEARLVFEERRRRLRDEGLDASAFLAAAAERLVQIVQAMDAAFPLAGPELAFRHAELAARLDSLASNEAEAGEALVRVLDGASVGGRLAHF